jgi:hypothetical protein
LKSGALLSILGWAAMASLLIGVLVGRKEPSVATGGQRVCAPAHIGHNQQAREWRWVDALVAMPQWPASTPERPAINSGHAMHH